MAYTPQTWANDSTGGTPINATRLTFMETGINQAHVTADGKYTKPSAGIPESDFDAAVITKLNATGSGGSTAAKGRTGAVTVASSQAQATLKDASDFVCTGTNDQTVINQALLRASRSGDGFGGQSNGAVELVGGDFFIGNNNTGVITMYPGTWLRGQGANTMLQPMYSSYTGLGCIQLVNTSTDHTRISDLTIGRPSSVLGRSHGIKIEGSGSGNAYQNQTGNDPFHRIHDVIINKVSGHGIYALGASGGARETHVDHVLAWDCTLSGFFWDGSSDSKLTACTAASSGSHGFSIGGGNTKLVQCKAYYTDGSFDGFSLTSGRVEIIACAAQDNGRYGFNVVSADATVVGCVADSNARLDTGGGGFLVGSTGAYDGLECFDRAQTPASPQLRGIVFSGSPQVMMTARVRVPSGTAHVVGSPGANSYMRVVRDGTTMVTAG